ncbi:helix-turn-helix domain-containing protein [Planktothrix sp. FACHB-1365]|uniref:winged helix-turn-helix transcriptional regulator n=1 Tax=Planktothrix sp. FACHB-1365 TaxID=2692855 RepID=UPI001681F087|nr:helix-turn-helix domain-containing protein [Planktothrix sp. FACHB-1365]MBD2484814.1 helix-turn-helix transcriptional regulator [Planktothrix sp. FACHB-1365]
MQGSELPFKKSTCPAEIPLKVMSGRWKILIIQELWTEVKRFNQLQRSIQGITHKMLTEQLRELEADGIIHRQVYAEIPPKVEYSLTELGEGLKPILEQMHDWGKSPTN